MKELTVTHDNLEKLQNIFESSDGAKHIVIILTIKSFVQRFKSFPELKEKVKLFALSETWEDDGSFLMTVRENLC